MSKSEASAQEVSQKQIFKQFWSYLKPHQLLLLVSILGMVGYAAVDTLVFSQLRPLIDQSINNGDNEFLKMAALLIVPLFVLRGLFNLMGTYTLQYIGSKVVMEMRQELFDKYIHLPVEYHDHHSTGSLISKVVYDTEQVRGAAGKALLTLVREGVFVLGLLAVMFYYSWKLSLIFFF